MDQKVESPPTEKKIDLRTESLKLYREIGNDWRKVRKGLVALGAKDHDAKRSAKKIHAEIYGDYERKKHPRK